MLPPVLVDIVVAYVATNDAYDNFTVQGSNGPKDFATFWKDPDAVDACLEQLRVTRTAYLLDEYMRVFSLNPMAIQWLRENPKMITCSVIAHNPRGYELDDTDSPHLHQLPRYDPNVPYDRDDLYTLIPVLAPEREAEIRAAFA